MNAPAAAAIWQLAGVLVARSSVCLAAMLAACGGGNANIATDAAIGAGSDGAGTTDDAGAGGACAKFDTPAIAVPAHVEGDVTTASVMAPAGCAEVDAPYGVASAGPDDVVKLAGLAVGTRYVVHLHSAADLAFYIATGCDGATGPTANECLLFEDATTGPDEVGSFVATANELYAIVDDYQSSSPSDPSFTLDVYAEQCGDGAATSCTASAPACVYGQCVACGTSFDCTSAAAPVCDTQSHTCVAGTSECAARDAREPFDDGPAGAPVLALDGSGSGAITGSICAAPLGESDYIAFDVDAVGQTWTFDLAWSGQRWIDLELFDAAGDAYGLSFWEQPQRATLTYLVPGRYYARVSEDASSQDPTPVAYTLIAQRTDGDGCQTRADCAADVRNQIYRGACTAGACVPIAADATVALGGACDAEDDCGSGLYCPSFYFAADADTRETCEPSCGSDGDCAPLGSDFVCTSYLAPNQCVRACTSDAQCPTDLDDPPEDAGQPWLRLACDLASGHCLP